MPYKVQIRSLLESLSGSRELDGSLDAPVTELGGQSYDFDGPITFEIKLTNTGAGIVASGAARARVLTSCVRCLCQMCITVDAAIEGFYVRPGHDDEFPEEQELELIRDDSTIDLEPAIVQSIVVELPFAPVHDPDCKGICPVCGEDRNVSECGCVAAGPGSPFDVLRDLDTGSGTDS